MKPYHCSCSLILVNLTCQLGDLICESLICSFVIKQTHWDMNINRFNICLITMAIADFEFIAAFNISPSALKRLNVNIMSLQIRIVLYTYCQSTTTNKGIIRFGYRIILCFGYGIICWPYYHCNTHLQWPLWQWIWLRAATNVTPRCLLRHNRRRLRYAALGWSPRKSRRPGLATGGARRIL